MAATLPPGIGNPQQASQATAFMRQQPWYQQLVQSWGLDPNDTDSNGNLTTKLSDEQQQQLIAAARDHGIGISESYSIDENGQIAKPDSHMLRNIAIAAGIAGLALTGFGAAGIGPLGGVLGGSGAAAGAGGVGLGETAGGFGAGTLSATSLGLPVTAGLGTAGAVGTGASTLGLLGKVGSLTSDIGKGVGAATTAAGQNALNQEQLGLSAANTDISGQSAYTNEELAIAKENAALENQHLKDQYMAEKAAHPSVSPFNITGGPKYSPEYLSTLQTMAAQNPEVLKAPTPYTPITPSGLQRATGTTPSTLQKIGEIVGPAATVVPSVLKMFA